MGICPRCGSWVDEGDVCRSCGGVREVEYGGYDEYDEGAGICLWFLSLSG